MASLTMAATLGGVGVPGRPSAVPRRGSVVVKAAVRADGAKASDDRKANNTRRDIVFGAAAMAVAVVVAAGAGALAGEGDPKPGTLEAKKKYAPVCVTMPTAKICHK
ncbi:hypothetical protein QJS04_geneDACA021843 [Acorus gramineus]|uniref:Photosystem II 5 kDa protein, chloroplastic n=1 Tax=Acorus gramineus TaxID=55184 RepID=A0AAV9ARD7_ACOGR|nr:hypothetical protein QJS04_geneDACA021843 [Acorus gramineus]